MPTYLVGKTALEKTSVGKVALSADLPWLVNFLARDCAKDFGTSVDFSINSRVPCVAIVQHCP
jgi:hypothetical protein